MRESLKWLSASSASRLVHLVLVDGAQHRHRERSERQTSSAERHVVTRCGDKSLRTARIACRQPNADTVGFCKACTKQSVPSVLCGIAFESHLHCVLHTRAASLALRASHNDCRL